jgi:hypothetical protein
MTITANMAIMIFMREKMREIWLSWPGDLALSCNPSYLGGQSSGMA